MTDQTNHPDPNEPEAIHLDEELDGDAVNVEAVNDSGVDDAVVEDAAVDDAVPAPDQGAGTPAEPGSSDAATLEGESLSAEHPDTTLAAERLADLQRVQAEYVNYKRRVDRDRVLLHDQAVGEVLDAVLPVLDEIALARQHGDLTDGPFRSIADKLEGALGKFGLSSFGAKGEAFDPARHEALMHAPWPADDPELDGSGGTTVVTVLQPGYLAGERVLRPARVAVADPE